MITTFQDIYTDLLDYVNRPASELLVQAKREVNLALLWMQRKHKFNLSERLITVTYPANTLLINITEACEGRPRDYLNFQLLSSADAQSGTFIPAKSFDAVMQERFKYQRSKSPREGEFRDVVNPPDDQTYYNHLRSYGDGFVFFSGDRVGLYTNPTTDRYLMINLHVWLAPLEENDDTNFLLQNCYDYVLLRAVKRMNIFLKDEGRNQITKEELDDSWDSCLQWDSEVMSATPTTV